MVIKNITERKHMECELTKNVEELERFRKLAIGREIKMIQLKEEINELLGKLGQGEKYEIVEWQLQKGENNERKDQKGGSGERGMTLK